MSSYHFELIIIPNHKHEFKSEILMRNIFPKLKSLSYELICVINNFYPATIKNDNEAAAMRKFLVRRKWRQQLHQLKKDDIRALNTF